MRLVFLGTGASVPSVERNVSATAIHRGNRVDLVDCGEATLRQMMRSDLSFMRLESIFITHLHGDHILGIPAMLQTLNFMGRVRKLSVYGPEGTEEVLSCMLTLGAFECRYPVEVKTIKDGDTVDLDDGIMFAVEVKHSIPSLGYVFQENDRPGRLDMALAEEMGVCPGPLCGKLKSGEAVEMDGRIIRPEDVVGKPRKGRKLVFSGDTAPCMRLIEAAKDADVLVHEATVSDAHASMAAQYGHSTAGEAAFVALSAGVTRLFMNHISNRYENDGTIEGEAQKVFPESHITRDLMSFQVPIPD